MKLEQYLEENYSDILTEYQQYLRKDELPQVGAKVEILVSGFGYGSIGSIKTIVGHGYEGEKSYDGAVWGDNYLELSGGYLCKMDEWWRKLKIVG